jgi:hypothetical protein
MDFISIVLVVAIFSGAAKLLQFVSLKALDVEQNSSAGLYVMLFTYVPMLTVGLTVIEEPVAALPFYFVVMAAILGAVSALYGLKKIVNKAQESES